MADYQDYQDALVEEWKIQHGTTPVDWNAIYNAQGMERGGIGTYTSAASESRPVNQLRVDVPWGAGRGPQYPSWLTGGGSSNQSTLSTGDRANYQKNFLNSVNTGNFYWPTDVESFGPSGWWQTEDIYNYPENNEGKSWTQEIPQGSWLWNLPDQYRNMFQETTPEIQNLMSNQLIPDYNRRNEYGVNPGSTRWMR